MTVRKFLDLSTAHLCPGTREWLDKQGVIAAAVRVTGDNFPALMMGRTPYGWFVHADETSPLETPGPNMPENANDDYVACMTCGTREHINLIDSKAPPGHPDPENADFTHMECIVCYGPGWCPTSGPADFGLSIAPKFFWKYRAWQAREIWHDAKQSARGFFRRWLSV